MKYEVTPDYTYKIENFDLVTTRVQEYIGQVSLSKLVISSEDDKKAVKNARTAIRKKLEEVKGYRKSLNDAVMGQFNSQTKQIENLLSAEDTLMKEHMDAYEKAQVQEQSSEAQTHVVTFESADGALIEKIVKYALKYGLEPKERKTK